MHPLYGGLTPTAEAQIETPANCGVILDGYDIAFSPDYTAFPSAYWIGNSRHFGGHNVGFADGHVKWISIDKAKSTPSMWTYTADPD